MAGPRAILRIRIEPAFCGPASVGTVLPIQILREELGIGLRHAKDCIDRCVFDGEAVEIEVEGVERARLVAGKLNATASVEADVRER